MASNVTDALPNPDTPLAFLDPETAYQTSVSVYVLAGALGVLCWDVIDNLPQDFKLLTKYRISIPTIVYFLSRFGSLGWTISSNIFETAPTGNCILFDRVADSWYPVSIGFSGLLFFFRVRAIYNNNPFIVGFFFILWISLVAGTILIPIGVTGAYIGATNYCQDGTLAPFAVGSIIVPLIHDTLVFCAISWRLTQNAHMEMNFKKGVQIAVFGKYLPTFTRSLLKDGQVYYLFTLIANIVTLIMFYDESIPVPMRSMSVTPSLVLMNIMACRVFRNTKFGILRESEISTLPTSGTPGGRNAKKSHIFPVFARPLTTTTVDIATGGEHQTTIPGEKPKVRSSGEGNPPTMSIVEMGVKHRIREGSQGDVESDGTGSQKEFV